MDKKIKQYLNERAKALLISYINMDEHDKELINLIFKTKPDKLVALNKEELKKYLVALSQYYTYFVYQVNLVKTRFFLEKKVYNDNLSRKILQIKSGTVAEKTRQACDSDESLLEAEFAMTKSEAELKLLEGMEKPLIEYINVLKRLIGETTYYGQRNE